MRTEELQARRLAAPVPQTSDRREIVTQRKSFVIINRSCIKHFGHQGCRYYKQSLYTNWQSLAMWKEIETMWKEQLGILIFFPRKHHFVRRRRSIIQGVKGIDKNKKIFIDLDEDFFYFFRNSHLKSSSFLYLYLFRYTHITNSLCSLFLSPTCL